MYQMLMQFLLELPMHLAVFACGAFGWYATRWVNRRINWQHLPPRQQKVSDEEEDLIDELVLSRLCAESFSAKAKSPAEKEEFEEHQQPEPGPLPHAQPEEEPQCSGGGSLTSTSEHCCTLSGPEVDPRREDEEQHGRRNCEDVLVAPKPEAALSDRVVRLLAKKAERKARKAQERRQLEEQLAAAAALVCKDVSQEAVSSRVALGPRPDEAETQAEAAAEQADASTEDGLTQRSSEDRCDELEWPQTPTSVSSQCGEEWMLPLDTSASTCVPQDSPPLAPSTCLDFMYPEALDVGAMLTALDPNVHRYQPIISADGQQLYTDGEQVYMMACMETVETQEMSPESAQLIHPIVDPYDPIHQVMHGLSAASVPFPDESWPLSAPSHDDGLWDKPWGDVF